MSAREEGLQLVQRFLAVHGRPIQAAEPDVDVPMVELIAAGDATFEETRRWLDLRTHT